MNDFDLATEERLDALADRLWSRIVGAQFNPVELNLRAKLALEHVSSARRRRLSGSTR